ncbi:MAG: C25 family cysteine peptidase, partial [Candidatus Cloacimonadia bacterium]
MKTLKLAIVIMLIGASSCFAATITKTYYFDTPELSPVDSYTAVHIKDGVVLGNPGEPSIPYKAVQMLLPQNESITSVNVSLNNESELGNYTLYPVQEPVPISQKDYAEFTTPDQKVYTQSTPFPEKTYTQFSTHYLAGYSIGSFAITPIKYIPDSGRLSYYQEVTVTITTDYDPNAENAGRWLNDSPTIIKRIESITDNPELASTYTIPSRKDVDAYDYIIVTSTDYADDFQPLLDFHAHRGYRTKIELIGDILSSYDGVDNADKLRNYFKAEYAQNPFHYVLLGGDTDIIPHRGFYVSTGNETDYDIPADMYYACLDRTSTPGDGPDWNNDNDNKWGEPDEADLLAEFYIGRICINNSTEIANFINKTTMYSETPVEDNLQSALMLGEQLDSGTYGGWYMEELIGTCSTNGYTTTGIPTDWDIAKLYDENFSWSSSDLFNEMNQGPNLLNHLGHANVQYCLKIYNSDLTTWNITNNGVNANFINGYTQGCYPGSFDNRNPYGSYIGDAFAEKITTMETGLVTLVANSRYGWYRRYVTNGPSQIFHRYWVDTFFDDGIYSIGGANQLSKEKAIPFIESEAVNRWCCYELNVFGDPAVELWTETPTEMSPQYPASIMAGVPEIDVTAPAYSRITVYNDNTIYGYGLADESGEATVIFDELPLESGIIYISIVAHNYYKFVGDILVTASVVTLMPDSIYVNDPTEVQVTVLAPDGETPEVGVNVWAKGLGYETEPEITDEDGIATLSVDYEFGPYLHILGQREGEDYLLFDEILNVIAEDLTNPDLTVATEVGLTDTFAMNLPGTI